MNQEFMNIAFANAKKAFDNDEVPVGAVIVKNGEVISQSYNRKEELNCCLAHAEIIAIKDACEKLKNWRLENCDIYITLDPCPMCASAIKQSRIRNVYSANSNSDSNNTLIINKIFEGDLVNPTVNFYSDIDSSKSKKILNDFFKNKRNN